MLICFLYYRYIPAFQHFSKDIKAVHFIGSQKPWNKARPPPQPESQSRAVPEGYTTGEEVYNCLLRRWWEIHDSLPLPAGDAYVEEEAAASVLPSREPTPIPVVAAPFSFSRITEWNPAASVPPAISTGEATNLPAQFRHDNAWDRPLSQWQERFVPPPVQILPEYVPSEFTPLQEQVDSLAIAQSPESLWYNAEPAWNPPSPVHREPSSPAAVWHPPEPIDRAPSPYRPPPPREDTPPPPPIFPWETRGGPKTAARSFPEDELRIAAKAEAARRERQARAARAAAIAAFNARQKAQDDAKLKTVGAFDVEGEKEGADENAYGEDEGDVKSKNEGAENLKEELNEDLTEEREIEKAEVAEFAQEPAQHETKSSPISSPTPVRVSPRSALALKAPSSTSRHAPYNAWDRDSSITGYVSSFSNTMFGGNGVGTDVPLSPEPTRQGSFFGFQKVDEEGEEEVIDDDDDDDEGVEEAWVGWLDNVFERAVTNDKMYRIRIRSWMSWRRCPRC